VTGQLRQFEFRLNLHSDSRLGVPLAASLFLDTYCHYPMEIALSTQDLQDSTVAIHGGRTLDSHASSILFPLYQTSTFVHDAVGVDKGFSYSRVSNPTVDALEKALGALEATPPTVCFRTGMAAITTLFLSVLKSGDHVVISDVVYGGTMRLFR
jgi:cystathionine beta-lyase/cystathionine gamma-synthase